MLTRADEYPIHQTPDPIAHAGTDPNFYDRFFFNGYDVRGNGDFFACAFGVYPHLGIMDAAVSVIRDGVQRSVYVSRTFDGDRLDTTVGPLSIEILEPLKELRIRLGANEYGVEVDVVFTGLTPLIEEPRFIFRRGTRTEQDVTRMTQLGMWSGWVNVDGEKKEIHEQEWRGARDRSWGVRPLGSASAWTASTDQATEPERQVGFSQFYWLWAPLIFEKRGALYLVNEDKDGFAWHSNSAMAPVAAPSAPHERMKVAEAVVEFEEGSRFAKRALIRLLSWTDQRYEIELDGAYRFYMIGLGYAHPDWQHGKYRGNFAIGGESINLDQVDPLSLPHQHVQTFCKATLRSEGALLDSGVGTLEQLILGPHIKYGFQELLDFVGGK